jgi:hypothetical protein
MLCRQGPGINNGSLGMFLTRFPYYVTRRKRACYIGVSFVLVGPAGGMVCFFETELDIQEE